MVSRQQGTESASRLHILGVGIDPLRFSDAIDRIAKMVGREGTHQVVTVNPEFISLAQKDQEFRRILNQADLATADGFGIRLAATYLRKKLTWVPIVRQGLAFWQGIEVAWQGIVNRRLLKEISELVTGSDLVIELVKLAAEKGYSVYFLDRLGGLAPDTPQQVVKRLKLLYPDLKVVGAETVDPDDGHIVGRVSKTKPDFLFVAFGFPLQEYFIAEHKEKLGAKVAIGVGGTLDYIAGNRARPPRVLRGKFEWLWRLLIPSGHTFTEYWRRVKRIATAFPLFPWRVYLWKLRWGAGLEPIKALALDFGGVTNRNGVEEVLLSSSQVVSVRQYPALVLFYFRYIQDLELGKIAEVEVWTKFMRHFGTKRDLAELRQRMINGFTPNKEIWDLVRQLKEDGELKLALLTNNIREWMAIWEKEYQLSDYFDPIVASCFVGKRKPNPAIFRILLKELGVPANETIFIDDHRRNVWMARRLGFRAIQCVDVDQCAETLKEILPT